ncbi:MAG: MFS transporter [Deltaproteobacteria bacterium]|nr:MFS transporter [Deltaproteobacteria bacterium]
MNYSNNPKQPRIYYGWYIVAASFLILFLNAGVRLSFGVMFKPMIAELGWSRSAISSVYFLSMAVYALSLIVAGKYYDRYGPKWVIIISTLLISSGYIFCSDISIEGIPFYHDSDLSKHCLFLCLRVVVRVHAFYYSAADPGFVRKDVRFNPYGYCYRFHYDGSPFRRGMVVFHGGGHVR